MPPKPGSCVSCHRATATFVYTLSTARCTHIKTHSNSHTTHPHTYTKYVHSRDATGLQQTTRTTMHATGLQHMQQTTRKTMHATGLQQMQQGCNRLHAQQCIVPTDTHSQRKPQQDGNTANKAERQGERDKERGNLCPERKSA